MSSSVAEGLLRTYAFLTAQAVIPIVVGSFKSLKVCLSTWTAGIALRRYP